MYENQFVYLVGFLVYVPLHFWDGFKMMTEVSERKHSRATAIVERIMQFDSYATHWLLGDLYAEVKKADEVSTAHLFIMAWADVSLDEFADKIAHMARTPNGPKTRTAITELLLCACDDLRKKAEDSA